MDLPPWPDAIRELDPSEDDLSMWRNDMIHALRARLALAVKELDDVADNIPLLDSNPTLVEFRRVIDLLREPS